MFTTATVPPTAIVAAAIPATIFCQRFQTIFVPLLTKDDKDNFAPVAVETPVATVCAVVADIALAPKSDANNHNRRGRTPAA